MGLCRAYEGIQRVLHRACIGFIELLRVVWGFMSLYRGV